MTKHIRNKALIAIVAAFLCLLLGLLSLSERFLHSAFALRIAEYTQASAPSYGQLTDLRFKSVDVGEKWGIAVDAFDRVWAWGWNGRGQLGRGGTNGHIQQPYAGGMQLVSDLPKVQQAAIGQSHALALDYDGEVWMWGYCGSGQVLPYNLTLVVNTPAKLDRETYGFGKAVKVGGGNAYSAALDENGMLLVWGDDLLGQHGDGAAIHVAPTRVVFPEPEVRIADFESGFSHIVAIDQNGTLWSWGHNWNGEVGIGNTTQQNSPQKVVKPDEMGNMVQLDVNVRTNLLLDDKGQVWQWGQIWGVNAYTTANSVTTPAILHIDTVKNNPDAGENYQFPGVASVHTGGKTNYFIDKEGKIWAWGTNGGYGFGTVSDYYIADSVTTIEGKPGRHAYSAKAFRTPTITGNGDQDIYGKQLDALAYFHPQVEGSATDPKTGWSGKAYPQGYWKHFNIGIKPEYATVPMPYAAVVASYSKPDISHDQLTAVLDADGNLWLWGYTSDGQIAWGYEHVRDLETNGFQDPNVPDGLWDYYQYEPTLARGVPGGDHPGPRPDESQVELTRSYEKIYSGVTVPDVSTVTLRVSLPKPLDLYGVTRSAMLQNLRYVCLFDQNHLLYQKPQESITQAEFDAVYTTALPEDKGSIADISYTGKQELFLREQILCTIAENCRVLIFAQGEGLYAPFAFVQAFTFDNFYTPLRLYGKGVSFEHPDTVLYGPNADKVRKVYSGGYDRLAYQENSYNDIDTQQEVYGIPLYRDGTVISAPQYLFDEVEIEQALPETLTAKWRFSEFMPDGEIVQQKSVRKRLDPVYAAAHPGCLAQEEETAIPANTHRFYYNEIPGDFVMVHMRFLLQNAKEDLPVPQFGYVRMGRVQGNNPAETDADAHYNQRVIIQTQAAAQIAYTTFHLEREGAYNAFRLQPIMPMNYRFVSVALSAQGAGTELPADDPLLHFSQSPQQVDTLWVTVLFTPSNEEAEQPYATDEIVNEFGKLIPFEKTGGNDIG